MENVGFFFLHGFLGVPEDWQEVMQSMPMSPGWHLHAVDYLQEKSLSPRHSLQEWGKNFSDYVRQFPYRKNILVGYSLGGRLALHALQHQPDLWEKVICLSANPGLKNDAEKQARKKSDQEWAERFQQMPWLDVLRMWNQQPVFAGARTPEPSRQENRYDKDFLALVLRRWSLSEQSDLRSGIASCLGKITWLVGEDDVKFLNLMQEWKASDPEVDLQVVPQASHRILFDQPQEISRMLSQITKRPSF